MQRILLLSALVLVAFQSVRADEVTLQGCGYCGGSKSKNVTVPLNTCHGIRQSQYCQGGDNYEAFETITYNPEVDGYMFCAYWGAGCTYLLACADNYLHCGECPQLGSCLIAC